MIIQQVVGSTFIPVLVFRLQKNLFVMLEVSHLWKFGQTQEVVSSTFIITALEFRLPERHFVLLKFSNWYTFWLAQEVVDSTCYIC